MIITFILIALSIVFIMRYLPVWGAKCVKDVEHMKELTIVDVRDYNQSYKDSINATVNIPVAYLKRYFHEIPKKEVHIIASTPLERNISIRFLRKKGYKVNSYTLTDCDCQKHLPKSA